MKKQNVARTQKPLPCPPNPNHSSDYQMIINDSQTSLGFFSFWMLPSKSKSLNTGISSTFWSLCKWNHRTFLCILFSFLAKSTNCCQVLHCVNSPLLSIVPQMIAARALVANADRSLLSVCTQNFLRINLGVGVLGHKLCTTLTSVDSVPNCFPRAGGGSDSALSHEQEACVLTLSGVGAYGP
jgi:hypothetical protein